MVVWSLGLGCRRDGADEWQVTALSRAPRHRRVVTIKCHPLPLTQAPAPVLPRAARAPALSHHAANKPTARGLR